MKNIKPRDLFLINGIDAVLSAMMLFLVLVNFESSFGMPVSWLRVLAFIAMFSAVSSFTCFWRLPSEWSICLKWIGSRVACGNAPAILGLRSITICLIRKAPL